MELPGVTQQPQMRQQAPEQMGQQPNAQPQQKKPFPATKEEALTFSNDILEVIYGEKTHGNIVKQLEGAGDAPKGEVIGMIAGNLVGNRVADVRGQTKRQVEMGLVVGALQATIRSLATIAKDNGFFELNKDEMKKALGTSTEMLDRAGTKQRKVA